MLDLHQGLIINHQSSSFNPICQTNNNHDSTKAVRIDEAQKNRDCESATEFGSSEVEFQVQIQNVDACSPKLWKSSSRNTKMGVYPLLPRNHRYGNLSPRSRVQAVVKGRMELMEMIQNMPESSYELSLKDIVDPELMKEAGREKEFEDVRFNSKTEQVQNQQKKKKKKMMIKKRDISRTGSMDNSTFLLKMFFPASLTVKNSTTPEKKSTTRKRSKVISRSSSLEGNESLVRGNSEWWWKKASVSFTGENIGRGRNSTGRLSTSSSSSSNSNSSRHADSNFLPTCWPFFHNKKGETWRQKGCHLLNRSTA